MGTRLLGYILIGIALVIIVGVLFVHSPKSQAPLIFSASQILNATWLNYTHTYLESGTYRTLDPQRGNITTSEGESYTMLRSVWLGDKTTFDNSWTWTKNNLQHKKGDHLFSWLFGKKTNGTYGILTADGGEVSASDADTDIALALLFAYARWQDHQYLGDARVIMTDIWNNEVIVIQSTPYLVANNKEKTNESSVAVIDPSYISPATYRIFAQFDHSHPWLTLVDSSYTILQQSISSRLDKNSTANIPPDWIEIDKNTGTIHATQNSTNTTNFGFDALRMPWRIALDWEWFKDPRAHQTLEKLTFLTVEWQTNKKIATTDAHDGSVLDPQETPAMYGGTIGYFITTNPTIAHEVYQDKLAYLYDPGKSAWKLTFSYYDDNWAWFGIALYNHLLPNLTEHLPTSSFNQ